MGIYDRPYYRDEQRATPWGGNRSMVVNLIIVNVAVWLATAIFKEQDINSLLALHSDLLRQPWMCWQLITYGFAHDGIYHILFNMLFLFFFGRELEEIYGRTEFLRIYLVAIAFSGFVWVLVTVVSGESGRVVGASGGVMAVVILFVLHFPRRLVYIWGVLPVPAWALGVFFVAGDLLGFANPDRSGGVANVAHLGGVLFGFVYFRTKMNLGRFVPRRLRDLKGPLLGPKLRIHDPGKESRDLNQQVDAILKKISREGESSLTKKERRTLEEASRRYQRRRE